MPSYTPANETADLSPEEQTRLWDEWVRRGPPRPDRRRRTAGIPVIKGPASRAVRDRRGALIDLQPIGALLERVTSTWQPEQIWLFGNRAAGDAASTSDWDLLVVVPDHTSDDALNPLVAWRLRKETGVRADIVPCRAGEFEEDHTTPNTLAFEAATRGVLLFD